MRHKNWLLLLTLAAICLPLLPQQPGVLGPTELLSWKSIETVELSPDGLQVIYALKEPDWKLNRFVKSLWTVRTDGKAAPVRLTDNEKDDTPKWSPDGNRIAFLSARDGAPQIWTIDRAGAAPEKLTSAAGGVLSFEWAPNGRQIAFVARSPKKGAFEEAAHDKDAGIVINKWDFVVYKLMNSSIFLELDRNNELWLADLATKRAEPLVTDVHVTQMAWSRDSRRIAVIFQSLPGLATQRSDVMLYSLEDKKSQVLLSGSGGRDHDDTSAYSNPIWSPDNSGLALNFRPMAKRWQAKAQLGIYRFAESRFVPVPGSERLVLYGPKLTWIRDDAMFLENTTQAKRQLFSLKLSSGKVEPLGSNDGGQSHYSFSRDASAMAFVRESNQKPPELFVSRASFAFANQITFVNNSLREAGLPKFERAHWKASDGSDVEGWLATPANFQPGHKYPLIVFVHGGPGYAVSDDFDMFMEWPYPYRLAATHGYITLLPNYRGTGSYSDAFSDPPDIAVEPADDIVTGIQHLVSRGIVDEQKIGIAGHSHGAWLGPQVLTTHKDLFRAASFAEGSVDLISNYGQMAGWLNINIHDYYYGGTPFGSPQRYLAISPLFHIAGLTTPTLLEFGEQSLAVQGIEFQSALWRCGVPNELIIYPKTGHNMSRPVQEVESMARNLDWFDYWMLGKKDPAPEKQSQYRRWEQVAQEMAAMRQSHACSEPMPHH